MQPNVLGIIPARFASTRLPGKPLQLINGKPMIQWVYENAILALDEVIIATDDARIVDAAHAFGAKVMLTSDSHLNGTTRCLEVIQKLDDNFTHVVNIQGDEPLLNPKDIKTLVNTLLQKNADIATMVFAVINEEDLLNNSEVFAVLDNHNKALYFSRAVIPTLRGVPKNQWMAKHTFYKHLGLYGYTVDALKLFASLPESTLELTESLEQNRWLEAGYSIYCGIAEKDVVSVDTMDDLEKVRKIVAQEM